MLIEAFFVVIAGELFGLGFRGGGYLVVLFCFIAAERSLFLHYLALAARDEKV